MTAKTAKKAIAALILPIALLAGTPASADARTIYEQIANEITDTVCGCSGGLRRLGAWIGLQF